MKELATKFKLIYLPFLAITIGFILIYTFLHWFIFIKLELFSVKDMFLKFWFPFIFPCVLIYFFLRPRLMLIKFKDDNKSFAFHFLAAAAIFAPTLIAQEYLITATGKITVLENISQFEKLEKTKYYSIKKFYIDTTHIGILNTSSVSGKNNVDFNILIYVTMPILKSIKDTSDFECEHWLGKKYAKKISNNLSNQEKKYYYNEFSELVQLNLSILILEILLI